MKWLYFILKKNRDSKMSDINYSNGKRAYHKIFNDFYYDNGKLAYKGIHGDVFYRNGKKAYHKIFKTAYYPNGNKLGSSGFSFLMLLLIILYINF